MKTITIKSTFAAIITASTLITTGVAPMNTAHAGGPGGPGVLLPGGGGSPCITKPWLCGPGGVIKVPPIVPVPPLPPAPPAPPAPSAGLTDGQKVGLGILGALAIGAVVANSRNQQVNPGPLNNHLNYCNAKYKTYDGETNTFMSNAGYRKPCISPFLK
ncbi:MAG: BA14K family protein [Pseudomonadota bacterium]